MCSSDSDSCKYVVSQDQQSEADIGPKKRKDQDAHGSAQKDRFALADFIPKLRCDGAGSSDERQRRARAWSWRLIQLREA